MAQQVREIMTGRPTTVRPDTDLVGVAQVMRDEDVGCVLVAEGRTLQGLVTDRDLVVRGLARGLNPGETKVGGVCSDITVTVGPADPVGEVVRLMRERAVRRVPVLEDGRPVGIVSIGDLAMERDSDSALADISAAPPNR